MAVIMTIAAGAVVMAIGVPFVIAFDKWKKEMEAEDQNEKE